MEKLSVISGAESWIEGAALDQLQKTADLPDMVRVVGMPDLHPGHGTPVGAVFISKNRIYPSLVGSDIGCGMSLIRTGLKRPNAEKIAKKLKGLEVQFDDADIVDRALDLHNVKPSEHDHSLGTIGLGNHFAELQMIEEVLDMEGVANLKIDPSACLLLVHSGSRGYGESILMNHTAKFAGAGITGAADITEYMAEHDNAVQWAKANRELIGFRFMELIRTEGETILDLVHNSVVQHEDGLWYHRKGAAPSNQGAIVIPGSRGAFSYLVEPIGDQSANALSVAHGAGRKWSRGRARDDHRLSMESLRRTKLGSYVICEDKNLLYEEAPNAYKDISVVVQDLVDHGLIKVLATLRPIVTYKTRRREED